MTPSPTVKSHKTAIPDSLGVPSDFRSSYTVVEERRKDFGATPRLVIDVTLPKGLPSDVIEANMKHAAWSAWKKSSDKGTRLGAVGVFAYKPGDERGWGYTVGKADFTPTGKWEDANPKIPVEQWRATVTVGSAY